ncbi:MAG: DUF6858 family protein [Sulfuricurvum sp.]
MTRSIFMDKYPIFTLEVPKSESRFENVGEIIEHFKREIEADPVAAYIGDFDHYEHTSTLGGEIHLQMNAAKMVVFCFGQKLLNPSIMAARPRSIAVADMGEHYVFTFLEAPVEVINDTLQGWVEKSLKTYKD